MENTPLAWYGATPTICYSGQMHFCNLLKFINNPSQACKFCLGEREQQLQGNTATYRFSSKLNSILTWKYMAFLSLTNSNSQDSLQTSIVGVNSLHSLHHFQNMPQCHLLNSSYGKCYVLGDNTHMSWENKKTKCDNHCLIYFSLVDWVINICWDARNGTSTIIVLVLLHPHDLVLWAQVSPVYRSF